MKYRLLHHLSVAQVLDDNALEQGRGHTGVPDAFGIHDDDRSAGTDAEAGRLAAFHAFGSEEQILALEQPGQQAVESTPSTVGCAETSGAHDDMSAVCLHARLTIVQCHGTFLYWPMSG